MYKNTTFRINPELKEYAKEIYPEYEAKSLSAFINGLLYAAKYGMDMPGSMKGMEFLSDVLSGKCTTKHEVLIRRAELAAELRTKYFKFLDTQNDGLFLLNCVCNGLERYIGSTGWIDYIADSFYERYEIVILPKEIRQLTLEWFNDADLSGRTREVYIKEIQKRRKENAAMEA